MSDEQRLSYEGTFQAATKDTAGLMEGGTAAQFLMQFQLNSDPELQQKCLAHIWSALQITFPHLTFLL